MVNENHVSQRRNADAKGIIALKVALISDWISNGIPWKQDAEGYVFDSQGERVLVDFPQDIKSFAEWEGPRPWSKAKGGADAVLQPVARSTINQKTEEYKRLRGKLKELFDDLAARATTQIEQTNKASTIERLETELQFKTKVIDQQEKDVIRLRREADAAKKELGDERDERQREAAEFQRRIAELESENAEHIASLRNVKGLKEARK